MLDFACHLIANMSYAFTLGIDMYNFPAIWAVLSILLDTVGSQLPNVQALQHVYDTYYQTCTQDIMERVLQLNVTPLSKEVHQDNQE